MYIYIYIYTCLHMRVWKRPSRSVVDDEHRQVILNRKEEMLGQEFGLIGIKWDLIGIIPFVISLWSLMSNKYNKHDVPMVYTIGI